MSVHASTDMSIIGVDPGLGTGGAVCLRLSDGMILAWASFDTPTAKRRRAHRFAETRYDWTFADAMTHALDQARAIAAFISATERDHGPVVRVAVESFVDQPSRARRRGAPLVKDRWKTPLVIGLLTSELGRAGFLINDGRLVFQNAGVVLPHFRDEIGEIGAVVERARPVRRTPQGHPRDEIGEIGAVAERARQDESQRSDPRRVLTNDHLRSAWAHAMWSAVRYRDEHRDDPPTVPSPPR